MAHLRGTAFVLLLVTLATGCDEANPLAPTPVTVTPSDDFSGQVLIPGIGRWLDHSRPVAGVSVTIVTGERAGESVDTKHDGRYTFPEFDGDEIHIRLEQDGYEPKEAIVHRSRPTTLTDRVPLGYDGPQDTPGTVLISMEWPDYIRPAMQRMQIAPDLILIVRERGERGMYGGGVIEMPDPEHRNGMTHEICHAQQQAVVGVQGASDRNGGWTPRWDVSPVGLAYQEATEADIEEVGGDEFWVPEDYPKRLVEAAAEVCGNWLGVRPYPQPHRDYLEQQAPNRLRWADEWLPK